NETVDGHFYRHVAGVWTEDGTPVPDDLLAFLRGATAVSAAGTVTGVDGETLHRLLITVPPALPAELRPARDLRGLQVRGAARVGDAGHPVRASLGATWRVLTGVRRVRASMSLDIGFLDVGRTTVEAPTDLWRFGTSPVFAYRLAAPASWRLEPGTKQI